MFRRQGRPRSQLKNFYCKMKDKFQKVNRFYMGYTIVTML